MVTDIFYNLEINRLCFLIAAILPFIYVAFSKLVCLATIECSMLSVEIKGENDEKC